MIAVLASVCAVGGVGGRGVALENKAKRIRFRAEFSRAAPEDILAFLNTRTRELDDAGSGLNIVVVPDSRAHIQDQSRRRGIDHEDERTRIDLKYEQISGFDLLAETCKKAMLEYRFEDHGILVGPRTLLDKLGSQARELPDACPPPLKRKLEEIVIPHMGTEETPVRTAIDWLVTRARELDPEGRGVNLFVDVPADHGVTLDLDRIPLGEALRYLCIAAGLEFGYDSYLHCLAIGPDEVTKGKARRPPADGLRDVPFVVKEKLDGIVIPQIVFEDADADLVLQYIIVRMREGDHEGAGVAISCALPAGRRVTVDLVQIALGDALRHVCVVAGLELKYDRSRDAITISSSEPAGSN